VVFAIDTILANIVTAITVDGATSRRRMARNLHVLIGRGAVAVTVVITGAIVVAGPILSVFSPAYRTATTCLQLLLLSLLPRGVLLLTAAVARHDRRPARIMAIQVVPAVLTTLGATVAVARGGINGVAGAYLAAQVVAALACLRWLREWRAESESEMSLR
jgi:O-antigen/teichoic acid export membrane protein